MAALVTVHNETVNKACVEKGPNERKKSIHTLLLQIQC